MSDSMDYAQRAEAFDRDVALANQQARVAAALAPRTAGVDALCIDCEEPIEPARLAALCGMTSRCASCAVDHERRMRSGL